MNSPRVAIHESVTYGWTIILRWTRVVSHSPLPPPIEEGELEPSPLVRGERASSMSSREYWTPQSTCGTLRDRANLIRYLNGRERFF